MTNLPYNFKQFVAMTIGFPFIPDMSWEVIARECSKRAAQLFNVDDTATDLLQTITAARMSGATYELYMKIEKIGVYSNSEKDKLEYELKHIIEDATSRGLLNEICLPKETVERFIDISPEVARMLWPKKTRDLMDLCETLTHVSDNIRR